MKKQPVFETILGLKLRLPEERVLKTKDFFVQEFVNLRKWLFFGFQHLNSRKCLETKEKVAFSDDLCLVVGVAGFEPTTTCPPDKCATRLRYAPIDRDCTRFSPKKQVFYSY